MEEWGNKGEWSGGEVGWSQSISGCGCGWNVIVIILSFLRMSYRFYKHNSS